MKLNEKQVQELFRFTYKKGVRWYDLQCELVDHLALQIEAEISKDHHLSFEEAVKVIYKRFGIFGFSKIVQEKEVQVRKQGNKLWWKAFKNLFYWPNILISGSILLLLIMLSEFIDAEIYYYASTVIAIAYLVKVIGRNMKHTKLKLLMMQKIEMHSFFGWFWYPLHFPFVFENNNKVLAILFLFLLILNIIIIEKISREVLAEGKKLYPRAFA